MLPEKITVAKWFETGGYIKIHPRFFEGFYTNLISFITHSQLSSFWLAISFIQPCQGPRWGHPGWIPWQRRVSRRGPCGPWAQCSCFPPGRDGLSLDVFGGSSLFFASHDLCDNYLCIYICIIYIYIYIYHIIYIYINVQTLWTQLFHLMFMRWWRQHAWLWCV